MTRRTLTLEPAYFDAVYASDPDPWKFGSSPYERKKYAVTLSALPRPRYSSALEIGCSIGVLTRELAMRCDAILAVDIARAPLIEARRRCAELPNVRFEPMFVPKQWPDGLFDLIVLSEVVYYLQASDVERLASKVIGSLVRGGDAILVHWTGETDYPLTGDEAADLFIASVAPSMRLDRTERYPKFRMDVLAALAQPCEGSAQP